MNALHVIAVLPLVPVIFGVIAPAVGCTRYCVSSLGPFVAPAVNPVPWVRVPALAKAPQNTQSPFCVVVIAVLQGIEVVAESDVHWVPSTGDVRAILFAVPHSKVRKFADGSCMVVVVIDDPSVK